MPSDPAATENHYGPACPKGLLRQIYEHHTDSGSGWFHAWDAETGDGTLAQELSKHFQSIISSSPNPQNITHAQQTLSTMDHAARINHRVHDPTTPLPSYRPTSLDLIVLSISLANSTSLSSSPSPIQDFLAIAADLLKVHGTIAVWAVGARFFFLPPDADAEGGGVNVEGLQKAWDKALGKCIAARKDAGNGAVEELLDSRLEKLTLDPKVWEDEKRTYYNRAEPMMPPSSSNPTDEQAENENSTETISISSKSFLSHPSADFEWLKGYLQSLDNAEVNVEKVCKKELEEVRKLIGGKAVGVGWPGVLVLGSKK